MYAEHVKIYVDGEELIILVPCVPHTPTNELKKQAIAIYLNDLKNKLILQNVK